MYYKYFEIEVIYQDKVLASETFRTNKAYDPNNKAHDLSDRDLPSPIKFIIEHTDSEDLKKYQEFEDSIAKQIGRTPELWDDIEVQITPVVPTIEIITLSELSDYIWTETESREEEALTKYLEEARDKFLKEFNKSELDEENLSTVQTFFNKR